MNNTKWQEIFEAISKITKEEWEEIAREQNEFAKRLDEEERVKRLEDIEWWNKIKDIPFMSKENF